MTILIVLSPLIMSLLIDLCGFIRKEYQHYLKDRAIARKQAEIYWSSKND